MENIKFMRFGNGINEVHIICDNPQDITLTFVKKVNCKNNTFTFVPYDRAEKISKEDITNERSFLNGNKNSLHKANNSVYDIICYEDDKRYHLSFFYRSYYSSKSGYSEINGREEEHLINMTIISSSLQKIYKSYVLFYAFKGYAICHSQKIFINNLTFKLQNLLCYYSKNGNQFVKLQNDEMYDDFYKVKHNHNEFKIKFSKNKKYRKYDRLFNYDQNLYIKYERDPEKRISFKGWDLN